jgi:hypothetical protein
VLNRHGVADPLEQRFNLHDSRVFDIPVAAAIATVLAVVSQGAA